LTEERYEIVKMKKLRRDAIMSVRQILGIAPPSRRMDAISGEVAPATESGDSIVKSVLQQQSSQVSPSDLQSSTHSSLSILMGIILGTLGRQDNPAILSRIRSLLHSRGIRSSTLLLSEIFPKNLEMRSNPNPGVFSCVQIADPRLSIERGH